MAQDYILPARRAILPALKGNPGLTDLIPAASIYGGTVPAGRTFPFTRFGAVLASPFRASGLDSSAFRFSVQAFTKGLFVGSALTVSAEDRAYQIGSAIKDALDGQTVALEGGGKLRLVWIQSSPTIDGGEADAWMTTVTFGGEVAN